MYTRKHGYLALGFLAVLAAYLLCSQRARVRLALQRLRAGRQGEGATLAPEDVLHLLQLAGAHYEGQMRRRSPGKNTSLPMLMIQLLLAAERIDFPIVKKEPLLAAAERGDLGVFLEGVIRQWGEGRGQSLTVVDKRVDS